MCLGPPCHRRAGAGTPSAVTRGSVARAAVRPPRAAGADGSRQPQPFPALLSALRKTRFDAVQAGEAGSTACLALGIELVEINKIKF